MKRWGLVCMAVLALVVGLTLASGAQEVKDEEFIKILITQSPWQGPWQGKWEGTAVSKTLTFFRNL